MTEQVNKALQVPVEELHRVARILGSNGANLSADLGALDNEVSAFLGTDWSGTSAKAFADQYFRWFEGAKLVHQGLAQMSALLSHATTAFVSQDGTSAASFKPNEQNV